MNRVFRVKLDDSSALIINANSALEAEAKAVDLRINPNTTVISSEEL